MSTLGEVERTVHAILARTLAVLVVVHVVAAVCHWIVGKYGVMERMVRSAPQP